MATKYLDNKYRQGERKHYRVNFYTLRLLIFTSQYNFIYGNRLSNENKKLSEYLKKRLAP